VVDLEDLERRVRRLEDIEAIRALKGVYARYCDDGYDPDGICSLFVEDGVWEGPPFGTFRGRDEIRAFFAGVSGSILWAQHYMIAPVIEVADDGLTANGKWYLFMPATLSGAEEGAPPEAAWLVAYYDDDYVKVGGVWRFRHLRAKIYHLSGYAKGWVEEPMRGRADEGSSPSST
jgi:hypothetical protein